MSKIASEFVGHQVPVQPLMRLQPGRWQLETATSIRVFNDGIDWCSYLQSDGRWVEMTSPPVDPFADQQGYWVDVDGEWSHFLGSKDVSAETLEAWKAIVRAVRDNPPTQAADAGDG